MGTTVTPNLGLIKPDGNEPGSNFPTQHGSNMDTLDIEVTSIKTDHVNNVQKRITTVERTSDSSVITNTETIVETITATLVAGKKYRITYDTSFDLSVADDEFTARIREDDVSGSIKQTRRATSSSTTGVQPLHLEAEFTAASSGFKTFVVTLVRTAGTGNGIISASSSSPTYFYVDYVRD